jgi:hypothetical protein
VGATSGRFPETEAGLPVQPIAIRKGREMKGSSLESRAGSLICPLCEAAKLRSFGHYSVRCESCGGSLSEAMLKTLRHITDLPDALGSHACECGHPEMRLLPDNTRHCPSCGSEVVPIGAQATKISHLRQGPLPALLANQAPPWAQELLGRKTTGKERR